MSPAHPTDRQEAFMPVITAATLETGDLKGADHGVTISLILDHSEPGVPHKFTNNGPGRSNMVCIHANPTMVTEWLE